METLLKRNQIEKAKRGSDLGIPDETMNDLYVYEKGTPAFEKTQMTKVKRNTITGDNRILEDNTLEIPAHIQGAFPKPKTQEELSLFVTERSKKKVFEAEILNNPLYRRAEQARVAMSIFAPKEKDFAPIRERDREGLSVRQAVNQIATQLGVSAENLNEQLNTITQNVLGVGDNMDRIRESLEAGREALADGANPQEVNAQVRNRINQEIGVQTEQATNQSVLGRMASIVGPELRQSLERVGRAYLDRAIGSLANQVFGGSGQGQNGVLPPQPQTRPPVLPPPAQYDPSIPTASPAVSRSSSVDVTEPTRTLSQVEMDALLEDARNRQQTSRTSGLPRAPFRQPPSPPPRYTERDEAESIVERIFSENARSDADDLADTAFERLDNFASRELDSRGIERLEERLTRREYGLPRNPPQQRPRLQRVVADKPPVQRGDSGLSQATTRGGSGDSVASESSLGQRQGQGQNRELTFGDWIYADPIPRSRFGRPQRASARVSDSDFLTTMPRKPATLQNVQEESTSSRKGKGKKR